MIQQVGVTLPEEIPERHLLELSFKKVMLYRNNYLPNSWKIIELIKEPEKSKIRFTLQRDSFKLFYFVSFDIRFFFYCLSLTVNGCLCVRHKRSCYH